MARNPYGSTYSQPYLAAGSTRWASSSTVPVLTESRDYPTNNH